jgi:non-specific serine/threonine protein kinase
LSEALVGHLRAKNLLLVLNNREHLIDACAAISDTLPHSCPGLRVLATSREALGIAGESTFVVIEDDPSLLAGTSTYVRQHLIRVPPVLRAPKALPSGQGSPRLRVLRRRG